MLESSVLLQLLEAIRFNQAGSFRQARDAEILQEETVIHVQNLQTHCPLHVLHLVHFLLAPSPLSAVLCADASLHIWILLEPERIQKNR